jgi:hypothetical protein
VIALLCCPEAESDLFLVRVPLNHASRRALQLEAMQLNRRRAMAVKARKMSMISAKAGH